MGGQERRQEDAGPASVTGNYGSMLRKGTQTVDFLY